MARVHQRRQGWVPAGGAGPLGLADLEAQAISEAMRQSGGNQAAAARTFGIGADALRYRLKKYDIQ